MHSDQTLHGLIKVLAVPLVSPVQQHNVDWGPYMHLPGGEKEAELAQALKHQDVMSRGTELFHQAATHKLWENHAARNLHDLLVHVDPEYTPEQYYDHAHLHHDTIYKDSVDNLRRLLPSVKSMQGEVQGHVEAMQGDPKKQAEAIRLRNALKKTETWAIDHGEDRPGDTSAHHNIMKGRHSKYDRVHAARVVDQDVRAEMLKNPKVQPPAQFVKDGARQNKTKTKWGSSSQQHH